MPQYIIFCFLFALLFFQLRRSVSRPSGRLKVLLDVLSSFWTLFGFFDAYSGQPFFFCFVFFLIAVLASLAALLRFFKLPHAFYSTVEL